METASSFGSFIEMRLAVPPRSRQNRYTWRLVRSQDGILSLQERRTDSRMIERGAINTEVQSLIMRPATTGRLGAPDFVPDRPYK